ncbi:MAG: hypothetical protein IPJ85_14885, partial [Flavobacteriales bacterium]|nr:hypothetical protein [Flavobacteriales bacterium]
LQQRRAHQGIAALKEFGDEFASVEHMLIGILDGGDTVSPILKDNGVTKKDLMRGHQGPAQGQQRSPARKSGGDLQRAEQVREEPQPARQGQPARPGVIGRDGEVPPRASGHSTAAPRTARFAVGGPGVKVGRPSRSHFTARRERRHPRKGPQGQAVFSLDIAALIAGAKLQEASSR